MQGESLWLGPLRTPVRYAMIASIVAAGGVAAWLIFGHFFSADGIGMYEMLRPEGRPGVKLMLGALFCALLFSSVYLSDEVGSIEPAPTGPFDFVSLVLSRLSMIGIALVVIVMFYEVVSRYVFDKPTLWANELSLWIAGFVFLFAGLYAMQQRSHIRIFVIYDMMPRWGQKLSDCISVALIWGFTLCLVWGGFNEAVQKFGRMETFGTAWDPPLPATLKPGILIIISLVALQALSNLIADWNKAPESHSPLDDIDEAEIEHIRRTFEDKP
ncbi:MAG: TRAP transporter small permease [Brucellaceae bacterium]|nr:TRAP transporter small permease [Brucellaceae bacterium]